MRQIGATHYSASISRETMLPWLRSMYSRISNSRIVRLSACPARVDLRKIGVGKSAVDGEWKRIANSLLPATRGFLAVHSDARYLEDAARLRVDVSPIEGDGVLQAIERIAGAPPELLYYVRKLLAETKGGG